jgi:release factor glutamine methyltransferase
MVLLADIMDRTKEWLLTHPEGELTPFELESYQSAVERVRQGTPVAYVLGWRDFFGRRFEVTPETLIPRPESELIIELAIPPLEAWQTPIQILDVGTGCGCLGITLLLETKGTVLYACDISMEALKVAARNAVRFDVDGRVQLLQSDLLTPFKMDFDLICGNLPYIPSEELNHLEVARWEPRQALDGGLNGTARILDTIHQLPEVLKPGGVAIFEIGAEQAEGIIKVVRAGLKNARVTSHSDLMGVQRALVLEQGG